MRAEDFVKAGDLKSALSQLQDEVRKQPAKPELRVFLFQLLSAVGQWERAMTQLNVAAEMDAECGIMAHMYRPALNTEALRAQVFAGQRSPLFFGEPAEWAGRLVQALPLVAAGNTAAAALLRDEAFELAEARGGVIDGERFEWIADADPRIGPMLEAIVEGRYYWIPFANIREILLDEPGDLRDLVWLPAHFTWSNGGQTYGLIPVRYPGTEQCEDDALRLSRKTEWTDGGNDYFSGLGQRMLATDAGDRALLEIRRIVIDQPVAADAANDDGSEGAEDDG